MSEVPTRSATLPLVLAVVRKTPYQEYDLCSLYYTMEFWHETYRGVISPIPHISSWTIPEQISEFELQPPDVRTVAGRRRNRTDETSICFMPKLPCIIK